MARRALRHQHGSAYAGLPACLTAPCAIACFHQVAADPADLAHQLGLSASAPCAIDDLLRAAKHIGLEAKRSQTIADRLLKGQITLDGVTLRYRPEAAPALNGLSLDIRPGEIIGIVGRSGSCKSTLTKLVQRLYTPEGGRILVDGIDISLIDAAQLRRQVGVVLQENLLFNRRVRVAIMALFVIALVWSFFGQIDIVAVASGRVVVSGRTKPIQPLERSVVRRVLVKDGDRVTAGQALVELDATAANADKATSQDQLKSALSEVLRTRAIQQALSSLKPGAQLTAALDASWVPKFPGSWSTAEVDAAHAHLQGEWGDITARLAKLASEASHRQAEIVTARELVSKLETTVPLARTREVDFKKLVVEGFISSHATQDKTRERIELELDLTTQRAHLLETQAALAESGHMRSAYLAEVRRSLHEREAQTELRRQRHARAGQSDAARKPHCLESSSSRRSAAAGPSTRRAASSRRHRF